MMRRNANLEERLAALEQEMHEVKTLLRALSAVPQQLWWQERAGMFKDDPLFDAIVEAGQEYRRSLGPHAR